MQNKIWAVIILLGFLTPGPAQAQKDRVLIFAAASLTIPLQEFAQDYKNIRFSFAASSSLARQVAHGAPADIFISANEKWIDWLQQKKLVKSSARHIIAANSLVLASPNGKGTRISNLTPKALLKRMSGRRLAIADPDHVPAGIYAKQALVKLGLWRHVKTNMAVMSNVRTALALIERREAYAGIVYGTDARLSQKVRVLYNFPPLSHEPIVYVAAPINKRDRAAVKEIMTALLSQSTRLIFKANGFLVD
jgi:molybdate transport system substrate-binding protein